MRPSRIRSLTPALICALLLPAPGARAQGADFDFTRTLRVDLHHVGHNKRERFMLDSLRLERAWPGSRENLVDDTGFGSTLAEVRAAEAERSTDAVQAKEGSDATRADRDDSRGGETP